MTRILIRLETAETILKQTELNKLKVPPCVMAATEAAATPAFSRCSATSTRNTSRTLIASFFTDKGTYEESAVVFVYGSNGLAIATYVYTIIVLSTYQQAAF
jgi:hypothetical protein